MVGHQPFQSPIFLLQAAQPLRLIDLRSAVFRLPSLNRPFAGSVIIEAVDVNLDHNMLSPTLNAFIFGHRVSISGRLRVQIRNLCVH